MPIPETAISFALEPKSKGDEDKLASALAKIRDEDPTITVGRDPQTKEMLISGAGQLQSRTPSGVPRKLSRPDIAPPDVAARLRQFLQSKL